MCTLGPDPKDEDDFQRRQSNDGKLDSGLEQLCLHSCDAMCCCGRGAQAAGSCWDLEEAHLRRNASGGPTGSTTSGGRLSAYKNAFLGVSCPAKIPMGFFSI